MKDWLDNFTSTLKDWFANALRNPKTTALGIAAIVGSVKSVIADVTVLGEAWFWVSVFTALGVLTAKDGTTTGTASTDASTEKITEKGKE